MLIASADLTLISSLMKLGETYSGEIALSFLVIRRPLITVLNGAPRKFELHFLFRGFYNAVLNVFYII